MLEIVAEETGYPTDLLDLDLDLEADLGIDTVKQAEVFATIREAYEIPRDDSLKLRDYPTLNHVIGFVRERAGIAAPAAEPAPAPAGRNRRPQQQRHRRPRNPHPRARPGSRAACPSRCSARRSSTAYRRVSSWPRAAVSSSSATPGEWGRRSRND